MSQPRRPRLTSVRWVLLCWLVVVWPALADGDRTILVLGDSLSAGYGIPLEQGWVELLRQRLAQEGYDYRVVNASISGDTTSGGRARLPLALTREQPELVVLELGGNDGLRGQPTSLVEDNLAAMIQASLDAGSRVLLIGIRIPPNYGPIYTEQLAALYPALTERFDVALVPFLMEGVATNTELMQDDGIHPTATAQPTLLENVWPVLEPLLER